MMHDEQHFKAAIAEIERHREDTEISKLGHWAAAAVYEKFHKFALGLPATFLSIVLAWLVSSQTKTLLPRAGLGTEIVRNIPVFISLIVSILSGMTAFLNLSDLAIRHRSAAENLRALWRNCIDWKTDFPDASFSAPAIKAAQSYRERLNDINKDAPQIPKWAWKNAQKQKVEGSASYAARHRLEAARARTDTRAWVVNRCKRTRQLIELGGLVAKSGWSSSPGTTARRFTAPCWKPPAC